MLSLRKFREALTLITVEPVVAIFIVGVYLTSIANVNLILDKTCRVNFGKSDQLCDALIQRDLHNQTLRDLDLQVQLYVSRLNSVGKLCQMIVPFVTVLLWGLWSDRHSRRKPLIYLPLFGEFLKNLFLVLCVVFRGWNAEVTYAVENVFSLVFGTWNLVLLGVFSLVMDTTTPETRTTKVAMSSIFVTIGDPLGSALSGVILREFGYNAIFISGATLMLIGFLYCVFVVKESGIDGINSCSSSVAKEKPTFRHLFLDYFNFKDFGDILKVVYRKRPDKKRLMLVIGYSVIFFGFGANLGNTSCQYLYTRLVFHFSEIDYSIFGAITSISGVIGVILIMILNTKFFHLNDHGLAIVGVSFGVAASLTYGLSSCTRDFYIGGAIDSGSGVFSIGVRAIMMKLVESHEAGKSTAIITATEGMLYFAYGSLYSLIYNTTIEVYAGVFYFVSIGLFVYSIAAVLGMHFIQRGVTRRRDFTVSTMTISSVLEK